MWDGYFGGMGRGCGCAGHGADGVWGYFQDLGGLGLPEFWFTFLTGNDPTPRGVAITFPLSTVIAGKYVFRLRPLSGKYRAMK